MSVVSLALALLAAGGGAPSPPGVGDAAPRLEVVPLDKGSSPALLTGDVVVVDFFATWCQPCHRALGDLTAIREALGPHLRIVLVDPEEPPATVREFFAHNPLPSGAQVTIDLGGQAKRRWGARDFPTTFLIDRAGVVRHINRGWGAGYRARMLAWLRAMIAEPTP